MAEWLTGLGLGEYKDIFLENDISGECHLCQCVVFYLLTLY